jgi:hypothetical protein
MTNIDLCREAVVSRNEVSGLRKTPPLCSGSVPRLAFSHQTKGKLMSTISPQARPTRPTVSDIRSAYRSALKVIADLGWRVRFTDVSHAGVTLASAQISTRRQAVIAALSCAEDLAVHSRPFGPSGTFGLIDHWFHVLTPEAEYGGDLDRDANVRGTAGDSRVRCRGRWHSSSLMKA